MGFAPGMAAARFVRERRAQDGEIGAWLLHALMLAARGVGFHAIASPPLSICLLTPCHWIRLTGQWCSPRFQRLQVQWMAAASAHVIQYVQIELHAVGAEPAEVYDVRCIELPGFPDIVYSTRDLYRACGYGVDLGRQQPRRAGAAR